MYEQVAPWYDLLDPVQEHAEEAAQYCALLSQAIEGPGRRLLELGAGAGNTAVHMQPEFQCVLTDLLPRMLSLSQAQNPNAEHHLGDMRSLRLEGSPFDAVLVHDAIVYMLTEADLLAAFETAFAHLRPGGAAIFAPDCTEESFHEVTELEEGEDGARALRALAWMYDPDPNDCTYTVDYAFLLKDGPHVQAVNDRHVEGLFSDQTWQRLIKKAGFEVQVAPRDVEPGPYVRHVYLARRPLVGS